MKKYLLVLAALSVILAGCSKEEEPKQEQAAADAAMEQKAEAPPAVESAMEEGAAMMEEAAGTAEEAMGEMAAEGEAMMEEAASAAEETMTEMETPAGQTAMEEAEPSQGKKVYDSACFACHAQGVAGAPKIGDKAAWEPRIAQGMDTLVTHAVNGFQGKSGVMPPKGGYMNLSDEEVAAAVAYMVEQAK
jgi:cytochrome c5